MIRNLVFSNIQIRIALIALSTLLYNSAVGQSIQMALDEALVANNSQEFNLFQDELVDGVQELKINYSELKYLVQSDNPVINFSIPTKIGRLDLTLMQYAISGNLDNKGLFDGNTYTEIETDKSIHFRGIVEGNKSAWVSFSFSENRVKGLIATNNGNWIIDRKKGTETYGVYLDSDNPGQNFHCQTQDFGALPDLNNSDELQNIQKQQTCPITLFWIADYDFYYLHGGDYQACLFDLDAIFNSVAALYQQEGISMFLGSRYAYISPDPYNPIDMFGTWLQFGSNIHQDPNFLGHDLAMLINVDQSNGAAGYAVIDGLCDNNFYFDRSNPNNTQGRFAASRIEYYYDNYPNYSSTVEVISHELGHNLSSRHTHWCGWPGGAIDGCASVEPDNFGLGCSQPPPAPTNSASLMSYCTSYYGAGAVPLTNGFGFYPNQAINNAVSYYDACICSGLGVENTTMDYSELNLVPNPSNGIFKISNNNGAILKMDELEIYNMTGGSIRKFENSTSFDCNDFSPGVYLVKGTYESHVCTFRLLID